MGARVLFTRGSPASSLQLYFPGLPTRSWTWSVWGTAVSGSGNTHITQSWRIRASHLPGHHGWFRDGRVTQVRHIRILPGFCQVSWEGWFEQGVGGGVLSSGRDRPAPGRAAEQQRRDRERETETERQTDTETERERQRWRDRGRETHRSRDRPGRRGRAREREQTRQGRRHSAPSCTAEDPPLTVQSLVR